MYDTLLFLSRQSVDESKGGSEWHSSVPLVADSPLALLCHSLSILSTVEKDTVYVAEYPLLESSCTTQCTLFSKRVWECGGTTAQTQYARMEERTTPRGLHFTQRSELRRSDTMCSVVLRSNNTQCRVSSTSTTTVSTPTALGRGSVPSLLNTPTTILDAPHCFTLSIFYRVGKCSIFSWQPKQIERVAGSVWLVW